MEAQARRGAPVRAAAGSRTASPWISRGLGLASSLVPLALSGCYAGAAGAVLGILSLTSGQGSSARDVPRIVSLAVVEDPPGAGRATDLGRVGIAFKLVERTGQPAAVALEVAEAPADGAGPAFRPATVTGKARDLPTSGEGRTHSLVWDARADGFAGHVPRVKVRLLARDGDGASAEEVEASLGNTAPAVTGVDVLFPLGESAASQNIVLRFGLEYPGGGDPSSIELFYRTEGMDAFERVPEDEIIGGQVTNLLPSPPGRPHNLTWDSIATFRAADPQGRGRRDLERVFVALRPDDGLPGGAGKLVELGPFCVHNSTLPVVSLVPPSEVSDGDGPVLVRFALSDEEEDPADVVLQWSLDGRDFPAVDDLREEARRRAVLSDPDERAPRRILTPRPRTVTEARCRAAPA
ncbi:MAG: hypothetical protein HY721_02545 [Planctomycetes bacterium]|nr:hypothetical protein [Planctomycetota bacterium]